MAFGAFGFNPSVAFSERALDQLSFGGGLPNTGIINRPLKKPDDGGLDSILKAAGSIGGAIAGGLVGGPGGAAIGSQLGGAAGTIGGGAIEGKPAASVARELVGANSGGIAPAPATSGVQSESKGELNPNIMMLLSSSLPGTLFNLGTGIASLFRKRPGFV